ncbi:hypothetical protein DFH08DRAFT_390398 [Mycena albidolilacea]|uniref:Uncharacterized protein n=1 Tax=Mycena albidolilacea TaxID=1033008 RepID=A0AAD6ZF50_9AGAR|nr:hypothetical protein DFH08DRAFT_390398 [Mycena albidolilacea]
MKIANFYNLGLALSAVQWVFGWWTVAHMPAASEAKDAEGLTYRSFLNLTSSGALYSSVGWVLLYTASFPFASYLSGSDLIESNSGLSWPAGNARTHSRGAQAPTFG